MMLFFCENAYIKYIFLYFYVNRRIILSIRGEFMKLLVLVLNRTEKFEMLLKTLASNNITGATIISSKGMAHELMANNDLGILGSFRHLLDDSHKESKTMFMVTEENKVPFIIEVVESVVGSLNIPDTGILFTVPVDYTRGFKN